jgi:enoyl-CoA hydratase/carnithine racemase
MVQTSTVYSLSYIHLTTGKRTSRALYDYLEMATYKHFLVSQPAPYVSHVQINRPQKLNAFYEEMWLELKTVFDTLSHSSDVRAIILSGSGDRAFTAGLDVEAASQSGILAQSAGQGDVARKAVTIKRHVEEFQGCISSIEKCEKRTYRAQLALFVKLDRFGIF